MNINQGEEDRISNLPDSVIGHILSFLPTKYAVATSVLSTQWKELWTLTTNLEFDDRLLRDPDDHRTSPELQSSFINFVDRVFQLCESPRKFHFKCSSKYEYDVCLVNAWITSVLRRESIQTLNLYIPMKPYPRLPGYLFRTETLVELKLKSEFGMDIAEPVRLPRLKVLKIASASFLDGDSFTGLLRGCPLLEKLSLTSCFGEKVHLIHIRAPVLTSLKLQYLASWNMDASFIEIKILLETPMLSKLIIDDFIYEYYEFKNLNHLKEAHISLEGNLGDSFPDGDIYSKAVDDIFEAVSGVQILKVAGHSMEPVKAIELYESRLPIFQHMTKLILRSGGSADWRVLPLLLEKSPHLRTLTFLDGIVVGGDRDECDCCIHERMFHDESCHNNYFCPRECVPYCLVHHLKRIELGDFSDADEDLRMIKYFLENARVLEKLALHFDEKDSDFQKKKLEVYSEELRMLPRPSGCEIELLSTSLWELTHGS